MRDALPESVNCSVWEPTERPIPLRQYRTPPTFCGPKTLLRNVALRASAMSAPPQLLPASRLSSTRALDIAGWPGIGENS